MEHTALVSTVIHAPERSRAACDQLAPAALAARLRTGCVYDAQLPDTFGQLVTTAVHGHRALEWCWHGYAFLGVMCLGSNSIRQPHPRTATAAAASAPTNVA
jgi:hypothetical protein